MKTAFLSTLAIILFATVNAQTSQTQTVTLNLSNKIDITFVSGAAGYTFDFTETSHYVSGQTKDAAAEFNVKSNRPWKVTATAKTPNFTYVAPSGAPASTVDASTEMPANVLSVRQNGGTTYTSLSTTTGVEVGAGLRGNDHKFKIDYKANPGFEYDAGQYKLDVVYTATQQ